MTSLLIAGSTRTGHALVYHVKTVIHRWILLKAAIRTTLGMVDQAEGMDSSFDFKGITFLIPSSTPGPGLYLIYLILEQNGFGTKSAAASEFVISAQIKRTTIVQLHRQLRDHLGHA